MNGSRGAKGSIKDRLISMLYRFRYKKKQLKQQDYTVEKKDKQLKYLNNLKEFGETENVNILSSKDQKRLDDVKYTANFKIKRKVGIKNEEDQKNDVSNFEMKLDNIESKTSELDEKLNIKKEIKKTKEEIIILKEVDKFIKESINSLDEITIETNRLKVDLKQKKYTNEDLENRYKKLKEKISKLKQKVEILKNKYDLSDFSIIESIKIMDSIENYQSLASLNEIELMVRVCKKEINKIDSVVIEDNLIENKKIGEEIDLKNKNEQTIKLKFKKSKDDIDNLKNIEERLKLELNDQQNIVNEMYQQASYLEKEVSTKVEYIGYKKLISSLFQIASGILSLPFTGLNLFGISLGSTMINKGLKKMNKSLQKREKIVIDYKYEDISDKIYNVKDKIEYTNLVLSDSLNEIKKLKNNFNNIFKEYFDVIPEYLDIFDKINSLENKLLEQQNKLNRMDKKLDEAKEINKQKLKKVS